MPSCATTRPIQTTGRTNPGIHRFLPVYSADQPETHDVIAEMRKVIDQYDERVLIGEIYLAIEGLVTYYGKDLSGAHLPFNFQLIHTAWTASAIAKLITDYEAALPPGGWPNWVLGNHDQPRIAARVTAAARWRQAPPWPQNAANARSPVSRAPRAKWLNR